MVDAKRKESNTIIDEDIDQAKDSIDYSKQKVEKIEDDVSSQEEDNNELPSKKELEKDLPKLKKETTDEVEEEKPTTKSKHQQQQQQRLTIIPLSQSKEEYKKAKVRYNYDADEDEREIFERQTGGNWTRQVTKIVVFRTTDDQLFLDWDEERTGKTQMGRKKTLPVVHVTKYKIPEAQEDIQYDEEEEANKVVQTDREANHIVAYACKFSKKALDELLDDAKPRQCEYILSQEGSRNYNCSKKDFENFKDFDHLYTLKADPVSTVRTTQ
jgi:hypothetical protein